MVLAKKVAIFDREWGRNFGPLEKGRKCPGVNKLIHKI